MNNLLIKSNFFKLGLFFLISLFLILPTVISAQTNCDESQGQICNTVTTSSVPELIGKVIRAVLGLVGSMALVFFIYGGLVWMFAKGNSEKISQAQKILTWSALGLLVIFSSYIVLNFIFSNFVDL